jgi:hypothetical protein
MCETIALSPTTISAALTTPKSDGASRRARIAMITS